MSNKKDFTDEKRLKQYTGQSTPAQPIPGSQTMNQTLHSSMYHRTSPLPERAGSSNQDRDSGFQNYQRETDEQRPPMMTNQNTTQMFSSLVDSSLQGPLTGSPIKVIDQPDDPRQRPNDFSSGGNFQRRQDSSQDPPRRREHQPVPTAQEVNASVEASLSNVLSDRERIHNQESFNSGRIDKMELTDQHPLSVYFQNDNTSSQGRHSRDEASTKLEQFPSHIRHQSGLDQIPEGSQKSEMSEAHTQALPRRSVPHEETKHVEFSPNKTTNLSPQHVSHNFTKDYGAEQRLAHEVYEPATQNQSIGIHSVLGSIEQSPSYANRRDSSLQYSATQKYAERGGQSQSSYNHKTLQAQSNATNTYENLPPAEASEHQSSQNASAVDNYQFLGRIREVDDDTDTMGNFKSGAKSWKFERPEELKQSIVSSEGRTPYYNMVGDPKNLYGTDTYIKSENPFLHNIQQQALWSSGKSREGVEQQLSFGGAFGVNPSQNMGSSSTDNFHHQRNLEAKDERATDPVEKFENRMARDSSQEIISNAGREFKRMPSSQSKSRPREDNGMIQKLRTQALAHIGEKACMRMTMKEMVFLLDQLNASIPHPAISQEDLSPERARRQGFQRSFENLSNFKIDEEGRLLFTTPEAREQFEALKKKTNLQLIESVRLDARMMAVRFQDFLTREIDIQAQLAQEKEKNQFLEDELKRYEFQIISAKKDPRFADYINASVGKERTSERKPFYQNNLTIDQLSPVQPFNQVPPAPPAPLHHSQSPSGSPEAQRSVQNEILSKEEGQRRSRSTPPIKGAEPQLVAHFQSLQNQETIPMIVDDSHTMNTLPLQISQDLMKKLEEKDREIRILTEYVENLKRDVYSAKQDSGVKLQLQQVEQTGEGEQQQVELSNQKDSSVTLRPVQEVEEGISSQQEKDRSMMELHTQIFHLKRQNTFLEDQLANQSRFMSTPYRGKGAFPSPSLHPHNLESQSYDRSDTVNIGNQSIIGQGKPIRVENDESGFYSQVAPSHLRSSRTNVEVKSLISPQIQSVNQTIQNPKHQVDTSPQRTDVQNFDPLVHEPWGREHNTSAFSVADKTAYTASVNMPQIINQGGDPQQHLGFQSEMQNLSSISQMKHGSVAHSQQASLQNLPPARQNVLGQNSNLVNNAVIPPKEQLHPLRDRSNNSRLSRGSGGGPVDVSTYVDKIEKLKLITEGFKAKLEEQMAQNQILKEVERDWKKKMEENEQNYAELRTLTRDLQCQNRVNSEALEKAQTVIEKLHSDLQQSLDAAATIQKENLQLKEEKKATFLKLNRMDETHARKEAMNKQKMERLDQDMNMQVRKVQEALDEYQTNTSQEKKDLLKELEELKSEIRKKNIIQQTLENKQIADSEKMNEVVSKKTTEALNLHNENLSLKIQMKHLEEQIEHDITVRCELNVKQNMYLKNEINDLKTKLNTSVNYPHTQDGIAIVRKYDQDSEAAPKVDQAYLATLREEFDTIAQEFLRVRDIISDKSKVGAFVSTYLEKFQEFKLKVIDNLLNWHSKSTELAKTATKYFDTLEEYNLMFVSMKQLIKEKDNMVLSMRRHLDLAQAALRAQTDGVKAEMQQQNQDTLEQLKGMTSELEAKIRAKEQECIDLINYQEEFREKFVAVCEERDDLMKTKDSLETRVSHLENETAHQRKEYFDYKEELRKLLDIRDGPHAHHIIPQHVEALLDTSKTQRIQITHYQEKCEELTQEMEKQRTLFHQKTTEMERSLEQSQKQYLNQQETSHEQFLMKEQQMDKQIIELQSELDKINHEVQMRERQIKKMEGKVDFEIAKQSELEKQIQLQNQDLRDVKEQKQAIKDTYDILEEKFKATQEHLDTKVMQLEETAANLKHEKDFTDRLKIDLDKTNTILKEKAQYLEEVSQDLRRERDNAANLQREIQSITDKKAMLAEDLINYRNQEKTLVDSNKQQEDELLKLRGKSRNDDAHIGYLENEVRKYQDSVTYLSRQVDESKLMSLDKQIVVQEKLKLQDMLKEREAEVAQLYDKYVNYPRSTIEVQTDDSIFIEMDQLHQDNFGLCATIQDMEEEAAQLREAIRRNIADIDRIIEEKRQLEHEVESKNQQLYTQSLQHSMNGTENVNISNFQRGRQQRSSSPLGTSTLSIKNANDQSNLRTLKQVLAEKQSYITKLETELNDLRRENEKLKDKIIVYELENLGGTQGAHQQSGFKSKFSQNFMKTHTMKLSSNFNDRTLADSRSYNSGTQNFQNLTTKPFSQGGFHQASRLEGPHTEATGTKQHWRSNYATQTYPENKTVQSNKSLDRSLNFANIVKDTKVGSQEQQYFSTQNVQPSANFDDRRVSFNQQQQEPSGGNFYTLQQRSEQRQTSVQHTGISDQVNDRADDSHPQGSRQLSAQKLAPYLEPKNTLSHSKQAPGGAAHYDEVPSRDNRQSSSTKPSNPVEKPRIYNSAHLRIPKPPGAHQHLTHFSLSSLGGRERRSGAGDQTSSSGGPQMITLHPVQPESSYNQTNPGALGAMSDGRGYYEGGMPSSAGGEEARYEEIQNEALNYEGALEQEQPEQLLIEGEQPVHPQIHVENQDTPTMNVG